jgi:PAS domain S-box-containing protein
MQKEVLYKNILEKIHDGIYFVDINRKITYWNKGDERIEEAFKRVDKLLYT